MEKLLYFKELYTNALSNNKYDYAIEAYSQKTITKIFKSNLPIHFKNNKDLAITVIDAYYVKSSGAHLVWKFDYKNTQYKMSVDSFLRIYRDGEFHDVTPKAFANKFLISIEEKLENIEHAIAKAAVPTAEEITSPTEEKSDEKITRTSTTHAHSSNKNALMENLNTKERAQLTGWILNNLYSIHLYDDVASPHHAYLYFKQTENVPTNLFAKVLDRSPETIFNNKRLNDVEFVKEFYDYTQTFMPYLDNGDKNVYKFIHPDAPEFLQHFGNDYMDFLEPFLPF